MSPAPAAALLAGLAAAALLADRIVSVAAIAAILLLVCLRAGDVLWWDFRSWRDPAQDPVVVGAFPEPFLQGYAGKTRPGVVVAHDLAAGRKVARSLHARLVSTPPPGANVLFLESGPLRFRASGSTSPGAPVRFRFTGNWRLLLRRPFPFRFRYSVP